VTFELLTLTVAASIALLQSRTKKAERAILSAEVDPKSTLASLFAVSRDQRENGSRHSLCCVQSFHEGRC
jgi:hypothetical protein